MTTAVHPYIESLLAGTRDITRTPQAWLDERRSLALERANALSVPTTRDEEWRFTDLTALTKLSLQRASMPGILTGEQLAPLHIPEAGMRLVFVDGLFAPQLSKIGKDAAGAEIRTLAEVVSNEGRILEPYLAKLAAFDSDVFAALNTAHLRDGAVIFVPKNRACENPVHVIHVATQPGIVSYPRCVVVAEEGAECTLVEEHVAIGEQAYLTNAVTEIAVARNAHVRHVRLQRESVAAFHIATCAVTLENDASYSAQSIALGARLSRVDHDVSLNGVGASVEVDGLALIGGRQLADTHSLLDHKEPNGRSRQLHKTIVSGGAHAVFNGKIFVRPGAQLTDSAQESRNLLLSEKAQIDAKPQLEIFADDVKCAHGATVGQLEPEQLFYLKSRGLPDRLARSLLTYAFGASVIQRIPIASVVARLEQAVMAQTSAK